MRILLSIFMICILSSSTVLASIVDVSTLMNNLTLLRTQGQPIQNQLDQLRVELNSNQDMLKENAKQLNQLSIDYKNLQYDFLTQELLISNYQEKHNLYIELLSVLQKEKNDVEVSQELLQQQLEDAKSRYDDLLVEVDEIKQTYSDELMICQAKKNNCFENSTVKRYQTAWSISNDQLKLQTELISDLGQLYHQSMSKIAKMKADELQYQDSIKQYQVILNQHREQFKALSLTKEQVLAKLTQAQTRHVELSDREKELQLSLISTQEQFQSNKLALVELETQLHIVQKKLNREFKQFSNQLSDNIMQVTTTEHPTVWVSYFERELKNHLLESSKKLVISQHSKLMTNQNETDVLENARVLLQNDIEPVLVDALSHKILDAMVEKDPKTQEMVMAFKPQILQQIQNVKTLKDISVQIKSALVTRIIQLGQLIAREGELAISQNLEQRMGLAN